MAWQAAASAAFWQSRKIRAVTPKTIRRMKCGRNMRRILMEWWGAGKLDGVNAIDLGQCFSRLLPFIRMYGHSCIEQLQSLHLARRSFGQFRHEFDDLRRLEFTEFPL